MLQVAFSFVVRDRMDVRTVARAGHRGFRKGKILVVPGLVNKLTTFSVRLTPRFIVRKIAKTLQAPG